METGHKEQLLTIHHLERDEMIVSRALTSQDGNQQQGNRMNENNTSDDAKIEPGVKYAVGDICMVFQTNKYTQFRLASIT